MASEPLHGPSDESAPRRRGTALIGAAVVLVASAVWATPAAADEETPAAPDAVVVPDQQAPVASDPVGSDAAAVTPDAVTPDTVGAPATVTITGTVAVGKTVSVDEGTWTPADPDFTYQWEVDSDADTLFEPVAGADSAQFTITPDLVDLPLHVVVVGTAPDLSSATAISAPQVVAEGQFTVSSVPAVTGDPRVGTELTATPGNWDPAATVAFQWLAGGVDIPGATDDTYTPVAADLGKQLNVLAIGSAPGYLEIVKTSTPSAAVLPGIITVSPVPTLTGAVRVGGVVTADPGTWQPGTTLTYQWRRNGVPIGGATTSVYRPGVGDRTYQLSVSVTGRLPGYTKVTRTSAASTVTPGVFTTAPVPTIAGTARVGYVLTAHPGTWGPAGTLAYRWLRNGVLIPGATGSSYRLTSADHGRQVTVRVYASRSGWTTATRTSLPTPVVVTTFAATYGPTITGTARVGSVLTASVHAWSPAATFLYAWRRNGVPIAGATAASYRLTGDDYNRVITVTVYGRRTAFVQAAYTSRGTARIAPPAPALSADGMFRVGTQIAAGTYRTGTTTDCYWERRSSPGDDLDGIIANDLGGGLRIVEIKASDAYFYTDGCGTWTRLVALGSPGTTIRDGVLAVGLHVVPGTYQTAGGSDCYWARLSGFSGEFDDIIENFIGDGPQFVRIDPSDVAFESSDCGTWTRIGD